MNRQLNISPFMEYDTTSEETADLTADAQRQASYEAVRSFDLSDEDTGLKVSGDKDWEDWTQRLPPKPLSISVFDVAAYILTKMGPMTTMKLQKLVYYSQAWSLVWDEKPLFDEAIEAWANGPVVRELFNYHRGTYQISSMPIGNPRLLNQEQRDTIDAVLDYYGDKSAQWLIDLTHMEEPWIQTRKGMAIAERGDRVIPLDVIADYYSSLLVEEEENA
jgi:uncharacterized phage-associated protein